MERKLKYKHKQANRKALAETTTWEWTVSNGDMRFYSIPFLCVKIQLGKEPQNGNVNGAM